MGLAAWLGFSPKTPPPPQVYTTHTVDFQSILAEILDQPVERLWREQPHLRTVVGFIARNIAQLGWHAYQRDNEDGRNRLRDAPIARLLQTPNAQDTAYDLVYATVASMCLYDESYWFIGQDKSPSGWAIRHIPSPWVIGTIGESAFTVEAYKIAVPGSRKYLEVPSDEMVMFHGWNPLDPKLGTSPVIALKTILAEQIHAQIYRDQMWKRGGRVGNWIYRPPDAPEWSGDARERWIKSYRNAYTGDQGKRAGGEPLFEDGMELRSNRFSAKDEQYIEGNKLSLETCAQVYFINPTMVGVLDNANYSNVREFRRALYGDTLGPVIAQLEQRINRAVVPKLADPDVYVEFNLQAKLAGSFEEQAGVLQTSIGAPWLTVNEGRARQNLPAVDGGDDLIRPLNVTQNGDQNPVPAGDAEPMPAPSKNGFVVHV